MASSTADLRSTRSFFSSNIPWLMRDTSKRSSIRANDMVELPVHRREDRRRLGRHLGYLEQQIDPGSQRRERISELVCQGGEERILLLIRRAERGFGQLQLGGALLHTRLEVLVQLGD